MPVSNYPFSITRPGDIARPYLPITIINPETNRHLRVFALIDTGADECAFPASFAPLLGHMVKKLQETLPVFLILEGGSLLVATAGNVIDCSRVFYS
ncbi:MAG: hypothetical protein A2Z47_11285 [Thermodesulfovibrio sp. RBG_19FT_COMBO_42_12]|nr:MAG: hypothetical protein A2Z47_11285 [Thermodesulfovibrio sp. RBG_19FT_COMBO_42_12]